MLYLVQIIKYVAGTSPTRTETQASKPSPIMATGSRPIKTSPAGVTQIQVDQSKSIVTDQEANEISRALCNLKSLALSVQEEGSTQNEKLDALNDTVDKANIRLEVANKKIKKLT